MQNERIREAGVGVPRSGEGTSAAERVCRHLIFAALGALFCSAELIFGQHPFAVALAAVAGEYLYAVAGGALLYALAVKDYLSLFAVLGVVLIRLVISLIAEGKPRVGALFRERPRYRLIAAALAVFGVGLYSVIGSGFRLYELLGILLTVVVAPLAAFLYLGLFERGEVLLPYHFEVGLAALVLTGVFAMRGVVFFGIYPAAAVAAGIAFLLVSHRGILFGTVGGALAGLCFDWRLAPAFLLVGLAFGLLEKSSRGGGVIAGSAAAGAYAFMLYKSAGLLSLLPSLLVAGALFLAFDSAGLIEGAPARHLLLARRRAATQSALAEAQETGSMQLREMSGAFLDLSSTFYEISSRMRRPSLVSLRRLCDKAFDSVCPGCRHRDVCWGSAYHKTAAAVEEICRRLYNSGKVEPGQIEGELATRCGELARILSVINNGASALSEEALHGDKTSVVAMDYAALGRVITETLRETAEEFAVDTATGERIFARLLRLGYSLESVAVCGKSRRRVILRGLRFAGRSIRMRELRAAIEKYCHFQLGAGEVKHHEGLSDIVFAEHVRLQTASVKLTRPKGRDAGKHCGDSVATFGGERGFDYAFICDGMGSGNTAALTSALASVFLTRLLQAGGRADSSLRMLNGFLSARSRGEGESSTTVDLLEIDRVQGKAALFKCGAAPTYLLRRGEVTHFFSRTAPVGILEALDAERIAFDVEPGDVVVQVSDGFTAGEEDCPWLVEMLTTCYDGDSEGFARMALNHATKSGNDDLSIIITEIKAAPLPWEEGARESA